MSEENKSKQPIAASDKEPAVPTGDETNYELLAFAHLIAAAPGRYLQNTSLRSEIGEATCHLYQRLAPRDAQESILALLAVSSTNASLDCFALAARVPLDNLPLRELNLTLGLKSANVAAELIKTLDDRRREKPDRVSVGAVNVEAGGQAIVGNVNSEGRPNSKPEETHDATDDPSGAKE